MICIRGYMVLPTIDLIFFITLLVFALPWPLISIALVVQFVSSLLDYRPRIQESEVSYLPHLPFEVISQIASWLSTPDLVQLALAGHSTHLSANAFLYRTIILQEHPSPNLPWFRRRLYRLERCLTRENGSLVRHLDVSSYYDIEKEQLSSILAKCTNLVSLSLPAIQEPIQLHLERRGRLIKQPVVFTPALKTPLIYANIP